MKTKSYLTAILFIALFITTVSFFCLPAVAAEPTEFEYIECGIWGAYVADTDPNGANVRSGPGENYPVVATLDYHEKITILGSDEEWMLIWKSGEHNPIGWVYGPLLAVVATTERSHWEDPSGLVPIYGQPWHSWILETAIIAWVPQNTEFRIMNCNGPTVKVRYKGIEGWLLDYEDYSSSSIPAEETEEPAMKVIPCDGISAYIIDDDPEGVNIRFGPGTDYPSIATLPTDRPVQVYITGALGSWALIENPVFWSKEKEMIFRISAWVYAPLLGIRTDNAKKPSAPVMLYSEPSAESAVVAEIGDDTGTTILECRGGWVKVRLDENVGWLETGSYCGDPFKECVD